MKAPLDSPVMADFVANIDRINAQADVAQGFVWRLQTEEGDALDLRPMGDDMIVNMSVWETIEALQNYVYKTDHVGIMRRRKEWFDTMIEAYVVLWWVPEGHTPTMEEAAERLTHLRENGPTPFAFTFRQPFFPPEVSSAPEAVSSDSVGGIHEEYND